MSDSQEAYASRIYTFGVQVILNLGMVHLKLQFTDEDERQHEKGERLYSLPPDRVAVEDWLRSAGVPDPVGLTDDIMEQVDILRRKA